MMSNPFQPNPFGGGPVPPRQQLPASPVRDEVNVLATLSVVFAFVFAPAGALFGHLGLAQIRRTGEKGRERALIGTTLSYVFITAAVVALIVASTLPRPTPRRLTAPPATSTPTPPPRPPVAAADLDGLLPSLDDVKTMSGDNALTEIATYHQPTVTLPRPTIDRPDCWGAVSSGDPSVYTSPVLGYAERDVKDTSNSLVQWSVGAGVAAYSDRDAAQQQWAHLMSVWRRCGGVTTRENWPDGNRDTVAIGSPSDAANGISMITTQQTAPGRIWGYGAHTIAVKTNVVADVFAYTNTSEDNGHRTAVAVTNSILGRIPG